MWPFKNKKPEEPEHHEYDGTLWHLSDDFFTRSEKSTGFAELFKKHSMLYGVLWWETRACQFNIYAEPIEITGYWPYRVDLFGRTEPQPVPVQELPVGQCWACSIQKMLHRARPLRLVRIE